MDWLFIKINSAIMGKPAKKKEESESEEQEQESNEEGEEEEQSESMVEHVPDESEREMQQKIMQDIVQHYGKAQDGQKVTWSAVYSLKLKEIELNDQLNSEIEKIKEKYELLKQPIYHQISAAALGHKLPAPLYTPAKLQAKVDVGKVSPQKIESFWGIVLDKQGLLTEEVDVDCVNKITFFQCQLVSHATNHIRVTFKFGGETDYFSNKVLSVESRYDSDKNEPVRVIKQELKYKGAAVEHSLFTLLFDSKTDINQFYNVACELYQDYANALYFYFREEQEEEGLDGAIQEGEEGEEDEEDEQDEEEDSGKPAKKVKPDSTAKPLQKPECKGQ